MTKSLLFVALAVPLVSFADSYNNYTGDNPYWNPLGVPNTATYGETFTAPTDGDNVLQDFSFYISGPTVAGPIDLSAYIAPWTGTMAGTPVYVSPEVNYDNTGSAQLSFSTGGLTLTPGAGYVMFLSVSQYYNDSTGEAQISIGSATIPGGSFVYDNNGSDYNALFTTTWNATGLKPDWAVTADFTSGSVPEPQAILLLFTVLAITALATRFRRPCAK